MLKQIQNSVRVAIALALAMAAQSALSVAAIPCVTCETPLAQPISMVAPKGSIELVNYASRLQETLDALTSPHLIPSLEQSGLLEMSQAGMSAEQRSQILSAPNDHGSMNKPTTLTVAELSKMSFGEMQKNFGIPTNVPNFDSVPYYKNGVVDAAAYMKWAMPTAPIYYNQWNVPYYAGNNPTYFSNLVDIGRSVSQSVSQAAAQVSGSLILW